MNLKKTLIFSTVLILLAAGSFGCKKAEKSALEGRLNILCTFLPIYVMTQNVAAGIPGVSVQALVPPDVGCPHDYMLTPTQAARLEKADVLVMNGLGMEEFLAGVPALDRKDLHVIVASAVVDSLTPPNPHAWVSPLEAAKMTRHIAQRLAGIDRQYSEQYIINGESYAAQLNSLAQEFKDLVSRAPNKKIVTFHRAFDYLARDTGLDIVAVIESEPGAEPSAKYMSQLVDKIKEIKPAAIFSEPQYSDRLAQMLSHETGVPVFVLDPAASGVSGPESYIDVMQKNLQILHQALIVNPEE